MSVFYGKAQALENVSIHVHEREFVSVVGLNGAGKTTLFNAISGLVPYGGEIRWGGQDLAGRTAAAIARSGVVHCPETRELFGDMSVRENLDLGGQHLSDAERDGAARMAVRPVPRCCRSGRARTRRTLSRRRAADAGDRALADDAAEAADPRRADAGAGAVILEQLSNALERLRQTTRSRSCSASRTSRSRCRTPTGSTCSSTRGPSGRARRSRFEEEAGAGYL